MIFYVSLLILVCVRGNIVNVLFESFVFVFILFVDCYFVVVGFLIDLNENFGINGDW